MNNTEENDNIKEDKQREKLINFGKNFQLKTKKRPTKTQKDIKKWKPNLPTIKEEKEQEKPCSLEDCSIAGGKKSRMKKTHKRKTRKFKKNRKFRKTSCKR